MNIFKLFSTNYLSFNRIMARKKLLKAILNEKYNSALEILDAGFDLSVIIEGINRNANYYGIDNGFKHYMNEPLIGKPTVIGKLIRDSYKSSPNNLDIIDLRITIIKRFLDYGLPPSLHVFSSIGEIDKLKKIISDLSFTKEEIEHVGAFGETLLGDILLCAIGHNHYNIVVYLLDLGVPAVSASFENYTNALFVAIENKNNEVIDLLLERGADPAQAIVSHHTPLDFVGDDVELSEKLNRFIKNDRTKPH